MKSLNKIILIGNATRDPELKYTPQGTAVCSFSMATNRDWKDQAGQAKSESTFHRIIAWGKLGEIISQYLTKGGRVYIEGRISNRSWVDQQNVTHYITEVIASDMILLDNRKSTVGQPPESNPAPVQNNVNSDEIDAALNSILFDGDDVPEPSK